MMNNNIDFKHQTFSKIYHQYDSEVWALSARKVIYFYGVHSFTIYTFIRIALTEKKLTKCELKTTLINN